MSAKSTNLIVCLLLGLLLSTLGCNSVMPSIKNVPSNPNNLPVKSLRIAIDVNQSKEFLDQLRKFADKHSLKFTISFYNAEKTSFFVVMYGNGFHINSTASPELSQDIGIYFLNEDLTPTPQETVDELFTDLKSFINEIPNVTIKEKIKSLRITMDKNDSQKVFTDFFGQLRKFAEKHSLKFTVVSYDLGKEIFLVEMNGDTFQITSEVIRSGVGKMNVDFYIYYKDNGAPTSASQETVDELFKDLKSSLGKYSNVTIIEQK
jgi:hypothetical protein